MPVSLLLCEGGEKSPDIRVLRAILSGINMTIRSSGGKYGLGAMILAQREARNTPGIAGILDRDFDDSHDAPNNQPRNWQNNDGQILFGWRWERCEIENYLIDSRVVQRAIPSRFPGVNEYTQALNSAVSRISTYSAARTALSISRRRFTPLKNCWGRESNLNHQFPDNTTDQDCIAGITTALSEYQDCVGVSNDEVAHQFENQRPFFSPGGIKHDHYLNYYSGKDLMISMTPDLNQWEFASPKVFREAVLSGIERSSEDVWQWLPEWENLRAQIENFPN
jgi:hypothetical protein